MKATICIAAASISVLLAACGPQGKVTQGQTSVGSRTYLTEWQEIEPAKLVVNFSDLDGAEITWAEQRIRDNHVIHQRVDFDAQGRMTVEYLGGPNSIFTARVTERFNDVSKALADMKHFLRGYTVHERDLESGRIRRHGSRGGLVASATHSTTGGRCVLGVLAFLSNHTKNRSTDERYDTIVRFRDCSGKRSLSEIEDFLNGLRIVSRT